MPRYVLISRVAGAPPNRTYEMFEVGTVIASSEAEAQPGDVVWERLCVSPSPAMQLLPEVPQK